MNKLSRFLPTLIFLSLIQTFTVVHARGAKKPAPGSTVTPSVSDIYYESVFNAIKKGTNVLLTCGSNQKDLVLLKPVFYSDGTWTIQSEVNLENNASAQFIAPFFSTGQLAEHKGNIMFLGSIIGTDNGIAEAGINVVGENDVRFFYTQDLFSSSIEIRNCTTLNN